jgi:hypothetical protein
MHGKASTSRSHPHRPVRQTFSTFSTFSRHLIRIQRAIQLQTTGQWRFSNRTTKSKRQITIGWLMLLKCSREAYADSDPKDVQVLRTQEGKPYVVRISDPISRLEFILRNEGRKYLRHREPWIKTSTFTLT